ncbi:hypothetical protein [Streptosporangium sp. NPDC023615]|uniref:hypothetical protein n=1 Tax=Streptosporangium sp. NPDC023615 TaxID=3154794 RepID=UPI0034340E6E
MAVPPQAAALFVSAWGHLHGLVVLEVFGHTAFVGPLQVETFRGAMYTLLADVHRRVPARPASYPNASVSHVR